MIALHQRSYGLYTALSFVRFILSDEGRKILEATGQPPIVPPLTKGEIPRELK